jgi:phosphatidylglycerophosphatase A
LPVFLLNSKGDTEIALKQREGSALRYRYLRLFGIPVIPISENFIADLGFVIKYQMKIPFQFLSKIVATVFFIGYIPFAPGTFGSLAGVIFIWAFKPDVPGQVILLITGFVLGVLSSHIVEKDSGTKDSKHIVIDEFVGYMASIIFFPLTAGYIVSAFFLFRFFDILKPPPIRNLERMFSGGIGVMIDDLAAGIITNLILQLWRLV